MDPKRDQSEELIQRFISNAEALRQVRWDLDQLRQRSEAIAEEMNALYQRQTELQADVFDCVEELEPLGVVTPDMREIIESLRTSKA